MELQDKTQEIPYRGMILNGFAMLAAVILLIPAIVVAIAFILPDKGSDTYGAILGVTIGVAAEVHRPRQPGQGGGGGGIFSRPASSRNSRTSRES